MAKIIVNHRVADFNKWKEGYSSDAARRSEMGVTEIAVGRKSDDPSMVYLIMDIKEPKHALAMFNDPQLQQAMKDAGVISAPEVVVIEE